MSVTQLTLLTSLSMMGAGIIMLPAKFAEIGAISMLSWIVTALASGAVAYVFAQCGMLSKRMGGLGGFAKYAFGEPGAFLVKPPQQHTPRLLDDTCFHKHTSYLKRRTAM